MATIEQTRADRAQQALHNQVEHQLEARAETKPAGAKTAGAKGLVIADGVDQVAVQADVSVHAEAAMNTTTSGANPFSSLTTSSESAVATTLTLAPAVDVEIPLAPSIEHVAAFNGILLSTLKQGDISQAAKASRVQTGILLVASDTSQTAETELGEAYESVRTLSETLSDQKVEDHNDTKTLAKTKAAVQASLGNIPSNMDVNSYVQSVLRESYMLQQTQLKDIGDELKEANDKRAAIQDAMHDVRGLKSSLGSGRAKPADFDALGITLAQDQIDALNGVYPGEVVLSEKSQQLADLNAQQPSPDGDVEAARQAQIKGLTDDVDALNKGRTDFYKGGQKMSADMKKSIEDAIQTKLDDQQNQYDTAGGDAQMVQLRLQDALQKAQETMTMMSNISKMLHETMMSVIRNMGG